MQQNNALSKCLSGIRVVDFTSNIAGPFSTMILADLGAEVIKIEPVEKGDPARQMAPSLAGTSPSFEAINRGKYSVALDLKSPQDLSGAKNIIKSCDVLVESFRPDVMGRLGLGYDTIKVLKPGLVYCSLSAFGHEKIGRHKGAYDPLIQAFSGMLAMTGEEGREPVRSGASVSDVSTGMWVAMGILAALRLPVDERGMHLQVSLLDSVMSFMSHQVTTCLTTGKDIPPAGTASPLVAPYQALKAADGSVMVAAGNNAIFARFLKVLGLEEMHSDERFANPTARVSNRAALVAKIETVFSKQPISIWLETLEQAGVPCSRINTIREALVDPLISDRELLQRFADDGPAVVKLPLRSSTHPISPTRRAPKLNEHKHLFVNSH